VITIVKTLRRLAMNKQQAENEMKYRVIKILLKTMVSENLIDDAECEIIRKKLIDKLHPLIGQLD
jgi:hypothetical protein